MKNYFKKFEIRWADIDANRHLANASYMQYCSHTRLSFMAKNGFGQAEFAAINIGPAAIKEIFCFFREVHTSDTIYVGLELSGLSEDGTFFEFIHRIYRQDGKNVAYSSIAGCWMSMITRKVTVPPQDLLKIFKQDVPYADNFRVMTIKDLRDSEIKPKHVKEVVLSDCY